jgi:CYTH domain-containing protein
MDQYHRGLGERWRRHVDAVMTAQDKIDAHTLADVRRRIIDRQKVGTPDDLTKLLYS